MFENQRRETRVEMRVNVTVVRGRSTVALETSDVSFKGLSFVTDDPPPLRSLVRLRIALPTREIEAHAMVVHVTTGDVPEVHGPLGVGLQFWGLAGPDRLVWDDFVRTILQTARGSSKLPVDSDVRPIAHVASGIHAARSTMPSPPTYAVRKK